MTLKSIVYWEPTPPEAPYQTLVLWQGTTVTARDDVEDFFAKECSSRIKRVGCVKRLDGRLDFAFFVHDEDITKFAVQRFKLRECGVPRWWEDIYFNNQQDEYPQDFLNFYPDV